MHKFFFIFYFERNMNSVKLTPKIKCVNSDDEEMACIHPFFGINNYYEKEVT